MKQAITLFLGACALLAAVLPPGSRAEGVITLKSGEKLPGSLDTLDSPYLKVRSSILSKPVDVNLEELDELVSSRPLEIPEQFSVIRLANGDEFYGTLKALDTESLQLQTAWGGLLPVNRKYVRHIGFDSQKAYLRNATESLQGWKSSANSMLPECRNGYWIMRGSNNTELQTSFPMPSRLHVQFSLYHTNTFRINLSLWQDSNSGSSIDLGLSLEKAELSKNSSGRWGGSKGTRSGTGMPTRASSVPTFIFTPTRKKAITTYTSTENRLAGGRRSRTWTISLRMKAGTMRKKTGKPPKSMNSNRAILLP